MDKNNYIWAFAFAFSAAALGSIASVLLVTAVLWAVISVMLRRFSLKYTNASFGFGIASAAYGGVILIFSIFHGAPSYGKLVGLLVFLVAALAVGPRLNLSHCAKLFKGLIIGAAFGAIIIVPLSQYQYYILGERASGLAGNPGIFAVVSLLLGALGALNLNSKDRRLKLLGILSLFAMTLNVFASEMRGIWLTTLVVLPILAWAIWPTVSARGRLKGGIAAIIFVTAFSFFVGDRVVERVALIQDDLQRLELSNDFYSSTGLRLILLDAGVSAALESPIVGYGLGNRMQALRAHIDPQIEPRIGNFTHPHNGFLAAQLDAGIFGLLALLAMLLSPPILVMKYFKKENDKRLRVAGALILSATFIGSGMTNILFQHDITDSVFVGTALLILCGWQQVDAGESDRANV